MNIKGCERMIIADDKKIKKLNSISVNDVYILADFDGTITEDNSDSSWASIFKNPKVTKDFVDECIRVFSHYHKFEIDESLLVQEKMSIMSEWYRKNIETLINFGITEEIINYAANNESIMAFRDGALEFLKQMNKKNIPIIIISAGVGNIIEQFLIRNNCNYPNIHICSNFLEYNVGVVSGVRNNNLIHPLNKNEISLSSDIKKIISRRENIIILGNNITDVNMVSSNKSVYKIGFLDENIEDRIESFKENFDIVCTHNTSYDEIRSKIKILN